MQWYEDEVRALESKIHGEAFRKEVTIFYGSSSIRLWDNLAEHFAPFSVENLGFGGSTLQACVHFYDRLIIPSAPASLMFYAGDNDIGDGKHAEEVMRFFESFLSKRAQHHPRLPLAVISIKPSPSRLNELPKIRQVNAYMKSRLEEIDNARYIDVHSHMFAVDGMPDPLLFAEDGLHLSTMGYALWRDIVLRQTRDILV